MIYLKNGNIPLNFAFDDEIVQEANSTYQLTFKFPVKNYLFKELKEEVLLLADDLHGEQEFIIFEIVNNHGYCTVYANQVASLLHAYSINELSVDRVTGVSVMSTLSSSIIRENEFSFSSDIQDKHTLNLKNTSVMNVLAKDQHSIIGQWGGDLVRDKYDIRLLKNGGTENESLFMYKKNMKSYKQSKSIKELRTRIHFRKNLEKKDDAPVKQISITIDSPLINKYQNIYEYDMDVNDQDVKDIETLTQYGKKYFKESLCDIIEDNIEIDVAGIPDVDIKMFDVVSIFHEQFNLDIRKKISKYKYSPMGKKLKSIGFGKVQQGLGSTLSGMVNDEVSQQTRYLQSDIDARVEKELKNADLAFDRKAEKLKESVDDNLEQIKAKNEENAHKLKTEIENSVTQGMTQEIHRATDDFYNRLNSTKNEFNGLLSSNYNTLLNEISTAQNKISVIEKNTSDLISREITKVGDTYVSKSLLSDAIAGVERKFENIEVGGRNLIPDYSFQKTVFHELNSKWIFERVPDPNAHSGYHLKATCTLGGNGGPQSYFVDLRKPEFQNKKMVFAVDIKCSKNTNMGIGPEAFDRGHRMFDVTSDWQRIVIKDTVNFKNNYSFRFYNDWKTQWAIGDVIYIRDPQLEEGVIATTPRPAPEELNIGGRNLFLNTKDFTGEWFNKSTWGDDLVGYKNFKVMKKTGIWNGLSQPIQVEAGESYTFSCFAKTDKDDDKAMFYLRNGAITPLPEADVQFQSVALSSEWRRVSVTFKITKSGRIVPRLERDTHGILYVCALKFEKGTVPTDWTPAPEDSEKVMEYKMAEYRQTIDGQIATIKSVADGGITRITSLSDDVNAIRRSVSSLNNDVLKKSEVSITDEGINLGTGQIINGNRLASLISVKPDAISLLTDKMVITSANMNLVKYECRSKVHTKPDYITIEYTGNEREFVITGHATTIVDAEKGFYIDAKLYHSASSSSWGARAPTVKTTGEFKFDVKATSDKPIIKIIFYLNSASDTNQIYIENLSIIPKTKAIVIENGSITGDHLKFNSVTTSHIQAGSINTLHIQTDAITSNHLKVDQAMINKLMVNDLLVNSLFAKQAFISKLKAIDIDATRITTGLLRARNGNMTINMLTGETEYKGSASIRFYNSGNTLHYQNGTSRAFLNFNDAQRGGAAAVLGVNSGGNFRSDVPYFAGIKVFRNSETQAGGLLDQVDIVADTVTFSGGYNENNGVVMNCITDTPLRVLGKVQFRSWMDGNGKQHTGVGIVTKDASNSSGAPIMYMDHRWSGDYLLYSTAGAFRYVSTMEASDIRLKENINPTKITALDVIDDMRFVSFDWREKRKGSETLGLIAQELELLDTKLIKKVEDLEGNETYTLSELQLILYALKGVQELINQNKQLTNRISYLESKIA